MDISNNDRWHSDDWIKNVQDFLLPTVQKIHKEYNKKQNSRPKRKLKVREYEKSYKGKVARKRATCIRRKRIKNFVTSNVEKEMIRQFYMDCPKGFCVDHIYPLGKGGEHRLTNMQWIPHSLNARKHLQVIPPLSEFPHCRLDLDEVIF